MKYCTLPLFSTPLYCTQIDISSAPDFSEITYHSDLERDFSIDNYILNQEKWSIIKNQVMTHICNFFYEEMHSKTDIKIEITTSIFNRGTPGQFHRKHNHANSILSGCLYFDFHPRCIEFHRGNSQSLIWDKEYFDFNNSEDWKTAPEPGLLLIWPSSLDHSVELMLPDDKTRYSLAFNTWISGDLTKNMTGKLRL